MEFSGDGTVLVGLSADAGCVWNAGSGEALGLFNVGGPCGQSVEVIGWPSNVHSLLHDPANERLLVIDLISGQPISQSVRNFQNGL